jgi:hypothetical protein
MSSRIATVVRVVLLLGLGGGAASCLKDPGALVDVCADVKTFATVSPLLEQRCGSLDCHGNIARPLRVYGARGLRFVDVNTDDVKQLFDSNLARTNGTFPGSGGKATTDAERAQTWRAVCGLQPEMMTDVVTGTGDPEKLLLLSKPLHLERHKGEKVFEKGSQDYDCIVSWLKSAQPGGAVDQTSCSDALKNP